MRIVQSNSVPSIKLPHFRMASHEFCELLANCCDSNAKVELSTGRSYSKTRIIFESLDEISNNLPKIVSPFEIKINSVELRVDGIHSNMRFKEQDRVVAENLIEQLKHFRPWYRVILSQWLPPVTGALIFISINTLTPLSLLYSVLISIVPIIALTWAVIKLEVGGFLPSVVFRPRDNFFRKHWEKIVVAVLTAVATTSVLFLLNTHILQSKTDDETVETEK